MCFLASLKYKLEIKKVELHYKRLTLFSLNVNIIQFHLIKIKFIENMIY
jgi:hypothetical protein